MPWGWGQRPGGQQLSLPQSPHPPSHSPTLGGQPLNCPGGGGLTAQWSPGDLCCPQTTAEGQGHPASGGRHAPVRPCTSLPICPDFTETWHQEGVRGADGFPHQPSSACRVLQTPYSGDGARRECGSGLSVDEGTQMQKMVPQSRAHWCCTTHCRNSDGTHSPGQNANVGLFNHHPVFLDGDQPQATTWSESRVLGSVAQAEPHVEGERPWQGVGGARPGVRAWALEPPGTHRLSTGPGHSRDPFGTRSALKDTSNCSWAREGCPSHTVSVPGGPRPSAHHLPTRVQGWGSWGGQSQLPANWDPS